MDRDVVVFKYRDGGFQVKVFKGHTSTEEVFQCVCTMAELDLHLSSFS